MRRILPSLAALLCLIAVRADGQQAAATAFRHEATGGVIGSAIGFGGSLFVASRRNCGEDLGCSLGRVATALALGTAGAALGTHLAGRLAETNPSLAGSLIGATAGGVAAIAVDHLLTEEANLDLSRVVRAATVAVTQGLFAAAGSRIAASARN